MGGNLFIISAPSGTGKSTVTKKVLKKRPDLVCSISCTTRKPRIGEVDGKDYHFISKEKFNKKINNGYFAEWAKVHDEFYGTPKHSIDDALKSGKNVLLDIDVQGGMVLSKAFPDQAITIFLSPPNDAALRERLTNRGTDTPEEVEKRLMNAKKEMMFESSYQHCVVNDILDNAVSMIIKIINGEA